VLTESVKPQSAINAEVFKRIGALEKRVWALPSVATFNPPYSEDIHVQTGVTTYADKDGKVVDRSEIDLYLISTVVDTPDE
jgi:hypothetical protein